MNKIWNSKELETATNGRINGNWSGNRIIFDSRLIEKDDIFLALESNSDGHNFIAQALEKGAAGVIISKLSNNSESLNYCLTEDTYKALTDLAKYKREKIKAKIIAVTGSVGKTTTKEMLKICFDTIGKTFASSGNYNNDLGVPLSLSSTPADTEFSVYEIGMNHPGEITPLTKLVKPDIAVITNVAAAHLGHFDSIAGIAKAKAEIFYGLDSSGSVILNKDNDWFEFLSEQAEKLRIKNILSFGENEAADARLTSYEQLDSKSNIKASIMGEIITYEINAIGKHLAINSIAALTAVKILGQNIKIAAENLSDFKAIKGRGETHNLNWKGKNIIIINDSYNAGPASVKAALKVLGSYKSKRKIAILSDMLELGKDSANLHKDLLIDMIENTNKFIAIGKYMNELYDIMLNEKKLHPYENVINAMNSIYSDIEDGDVILIKGSFGTEIYKLADYIINNSTKKNDL